MDWTTPASATGGGVIVAIISWLLGRTDAAEARRQREIEEIAKRAIRESGEYAAAAVEAEKHRAIDDKLSAMTDAVVRIDGKVTDLHNFMLSGRLPIKKREED